MLSIYVLKLVRNGLNAHSKPCCHCRKIGHHNQSICPKKFTISSETTAINQSSPSANDSSQSVVTTESTVNTVTPPVNTDHMLLEQVLLQTAVVPVCCANGSTISARILLDSASQRTFMTERLAKQFTFSAKGNIVNFYI